MNSQEINEADIAEVVLGTFNGKHFIRDESSKMYPVNANYASKSGLLEGDGLKLTILKDGSMIYKQIDPMPRVPIIAIVEKRKGKFVLVVSEDEVYRILDSVVTYFHLQEGTKVSGLTTTGSKWATVKSVI